MLSLLNVFCMQQFALIALLILGSVLPSLSYGHLTIRSNAADVTTTAEPGAIGRGEAVYTVTPTTILSSNLSYISTSLLRRPPQQDSGNRVLSNEVDNMNSSRTVTSATRDIEGTSQGTSVRRLYKRYVSIKAASILSASLGLLAFVWKWRI